MQKLAHSVQLHASHRALRPGKDNRCHQGVPRPPPQSPECTGVPGTAGPARARHHLRMRPEPRLKALGPRVVRPSRRRTGGFPAAAMAASAPGLISVFSSPQELGASLAQLVAQRAASCLEGNRGRFALGLSGGSLVSMLARDLPAAVAPAGPDSFARWTLGFCDERLVPFEHAESTYGLYRTHLLSKLLIPDSQVLTVNPALPVEDAAEDYAGKLRQEQEKIVAPISDSPKPPPQRVTLTLPVLNAAQSIIFVATGEGKAAVLKRILEDKDSSLPATMVQPRTGALCWFLDEAAARLLSVPFEKHSTL
ncbi:6-phosphogluconolactonase isoform X2 [Alexandromys fortis]|uniref:6-phosphogluconolactonase isoform X2 n=1 Tax=Alexandromys fortis TaxID=100897 RepID=UPI002152901D|nr:6-phosphogluconolactonase isoform X2 [Microtus fortis]